MKYTVKAGEQNTTPQLQQIIQNLRPDEEAVIEFEKATYYFAREGSNSYPIYASGGQAGINNVIFPLRGLNRVTIEGNGAEFVFCDRVQPFQVCGSKEMTFRNFSIDFAFLRYAFGKISAVTPDGIEIALDRTLFQYKVEDGFLSFRCGKEELSTKKRKISTKCISPRKPGIYFVYAGDTEAKINPAAPTVRVDVEETAGGVFFRYRKDSVIMPYEVGDTLCLAYDNDREAQSFTFEDCEDLRLENISIYRQGGMGVVTAVCKNVLIDGLKIHIKPGREEFFSTTADGVYSSNCAGDFILRNSLIADTYDDAFNLHGYYTKIDAVLPDNRVKLDFYHPSHWGIIPYKVGDVLHFNEEGSLNELGTITVKAVSYGEDRRDLYLTVDDASRLLPGMALENPDRMPRVCFENNTVLRCPHIRLSSGEMVVQNNDLQLMDNDIVISDLISFWGESGAVRDVLIRNNRFGNAEHNFAIYSCRPPESNHLHGRIVIEDNVFAQSEQKSLEVSNVTELILQNNQFGVEWNI